MEMTKQSWIRIGAAALVVVIACVLAWWAYTGTKKRELQQDAVALVQDSTARVREALGLLTAGAEARGKLEAHFGALKGSVEKSRALDASLNPVLVQAADAYVTDVHALLRRQLAMHAGREAVRADMGELSNHLRTAGTRSPEWIRQALALKQRMEKNYFDYRVAAGSLAKSLRALDQTCLALRPLVPADLVIEEQLIFAAEKRLQEVNAQFEQQVESARKLPVGS